MEKVDPYSHYDGAVARIRVAAGTRTAKSDLVMLSPMLADAKATVHTYETGREVDALNFRKQDFDVKDVAHALARICRYQGNVRDFRSVARHSIEVASHVMQRTHDPVAGLLGLLHDAPEAYMGDVSGPYKKARLWNMNSDEQAILETIFAAIGVPFPEYCTHAVKAADEENGRRERENGIKDGRHRGFEQDTRDFLKAYRTLINAINAGEGL